MPKASKNKKTSAAKVSVTLYWVSTPDHDEDWFIFAKGGRSAAKFHADYEGYAPGEAMAEPIVEAPGSAGPFPRHAQINDLAVLGFEILKGGDHGRSVKYGDRTFVEGHLESLIAEIDDNDSEATGEGRPRGTKPSSLKINLN
jgi:hypothetical protein